MLAYTTGVVAIALGLIAGVSTSSAVAAWRSRSDRRSLGWALGGLTVVLIVGFALGRTALAAISALPPSQADFPVLAISLVLGLLAGRLLLRRARAGRTSAPRFEPLAFLRSRRAAFTTVFVMLAISTALVTAVDLARGPSEGVIARSVPDACPMTGKIDAISGSPDYITVTWAINGGCQPYSGTVTLMDSGSPSSGLTRTYGVHDSTGSIDYPSPCFSLGYTLDVTDNARHRVTATGQLGTSSCNVANVYNSLQAAAEGTLAEQGFVTQVFSVCSSSVGVGRVRQVVFVRRDQSEVVLVDQGGATSAARQVTRDTLLTLKISTGVPCR